MRTQLASDRSCFSRFAPASTASLIVILGCAVTALARPSPTTTTATTPPRLAASPAPASAAGSSTAGSTAPRQFAATTDPVVTPIPEAFPWALARVTLVNPNGGTEDVVLGGNLDVEVLAGAGGAATDTDRDGLDQVPMRLTRFEMRGNSSLGKLVVRLRADKPSVGEIEEAVNTTKAVLDLPPFTRTGKGTAFFDIFVDFVVGDRVLTTAEPIRLTASISQIPPAPGEAFEGVAGRLTPLLDATGKPSGIQIGRTTQIPNPVREIDSFATSAAELTIQLPNGATELVRLSGPTTVVVDIPPSGMAADVAGEGREAVRTEMTELNLTGQSSLGPIRIGLDKQNRTFGQIREQKNSSPGVLDIPPFTAAGAADSFFDIFVEVQVGDGLFRPSGPLHLQTVITHKPPAPGESYVNPFANPIELLDANGKPTGIRLLKEVHTPIPLPPRPEIDTFETSSAVVDFLLPDGSVHSATLSGPTTIQVNFKGGEGLTIDSNGNGLDDVDTEMLRLELKGTSDIGPVVMRLPDPARHPALKSVGAIEETANSKTGRLDVPPFAETGNASSFFDVYFEVAVGNAVYHSHLPKHMRSYINHKPPQGGTAYFDPTIIELFDANEKPTGIKILRATHVPAGPQPEIDHFPNTHASFELTFPDQTVQTVDLSGPTTIQVWVGPKGESNDSDGDGLDDVDAEMVELNLTGNSPLGPVRVGLSQTRRSVGTIEETANSQTGRLDLQPFAPAGSAISSFDVFFTVIVGDRVLHTERPKRMVSTITHKPPQPGAVYEFPEVIELFDANNNPTGIRITKARHIPNPGVIEIDTFRESIAQISVALPDGQVRELHLVGPTTIHVAFEGAEGQADDDDGDGRDEVATEMVQLDLHGTDAVLGDVKLSLRPVTKSPGRASVGQIEELANTQAGRLDIAPFAPAGMADSFFDVFFELSASKFGLVLHNDVPKRMRTVIDHKPPGPGGTYEDPVVIELLNEQNQPTGVRILRVAHTPNPPPPEIDHFPNSIAQFQITLPDGGTKTLTLSGPTTIQVFVGENGEADDSNGNSRDDVVTMMTQLDLVGSDPELGAIRLHLRSPDASPFKPSLGEIEEQTNTKPGRLDIAPFAPGGLADSFFDIYFEVEIPSQRLVLHNERPKRMRTVISHKPPRPGEMYEDPEVIELFNQQNQATGIKIIKAGHTPNPVPEIDLFPFSRAEVTLQTAAGATEKIALSGPAKVVVDIPPTGTAADTDGDGLDQVRAEMVALELAGTSSQGPLVLRLDPARRSWGEIEERSNNTPGTLDVPPFTAAGSANSFFDIWFQVQVGTQVFYGARPVHMQSVITHKPPGDGDSYVSPQEPIELLNSDGNPTGLRLVHARHDPRTPEIDVFEVSTAQVTLQFPSGASENVQLSGPTTVMVDIPPSGAAGDTDGDALEQVKSEMTALDLRGTSSQGAVRVSLNPSKRSLGEIEETANATAGKLDVPPFTPAGTASSFFDVWFEVDVGTNVFFGAKPARMTSVITHKPPGPGDQYVSPNEPIDLLDAAGRPTGVRIIHAVHIPVPPVLEVDKFPNSTAIVDIQLADGSTQTVTLSGPTTINVKFDGAEGRTHDSNGNGLDDVATEMVQLDLKGNTPLGPVAMRLANATKSVGMIEETANSQSGRLDLPPFAPSGSAWSFFDVYIEVEFGGKVYHAREPKRMRSYITHKPPEGGTAYFDPVVIELFDAADKPTGIKILRTTHVPSGPIPEIDHFPASTAVVDVQLPDGSTASVNLTGETTIQVWVGPKGEANDSNGNGLDDVDTEMVQLDLKGTSPFGPVSLRLADPTRHPALRSTGMIEETANSQAGRLDLPPFAPTGSAWSFFDVFVEVQVGDAIYHAHLPKHMRSYITHKPPQGGTAYFDPIVIDLFDRAEKPSGIKILRTTHVPTGPTPEIDHFPNSTAVVDLQLPDGTTQTVSLSGPTTIQVWVGPKGESNDSNGNGLDDVDTEMVQLDLKGTSPMGAVSMRLADPTRHPALRSVGMIEEGANSQAGRLDLPPFAPNGGAWSFFDVFVEVEVGGKIYHAHAPKRMRSYITHKPPEGGTAYFDPVVIELFDANDRATGIKILRTTHVPTGPVPEIDRFPNSTAVVDLLLPDGKSQSVTLSGPTTIQVWVGANGESNDSNGNGLDDVDTEMVQLELQGTSTLGPVTMRLADPSRHPALRSVGMIEETANTQAGRLDLPPFAPAGSAWSYFDVFVEVQVGDRIYHAHVPKRMRSYITHKPPEGGTAYFDPVVIELFDAADKPTGIKILRTTHIPSGPPPEIDYFPKSSAIVDIQMPDGSLQTVSLSGPTTIQVWVGTRGESNDSNGNGLDDVDTEMVQLDLTGASSLGPIVMRLADPARHPANRSIGTIEETANTQAGLLDLPPFAPAGTASSSFDVYFEVQVGDRVYHAHQPKRMRAVINHKPPGLGTTYEFPEVIELFDSQEKPTGIKILKASHTPVPPTDCQLVLRCPDNIDVTTSDPKGKAVVFAAAAEGSCPPITVVATPASGSLFPVGTTVVSVVATDARGNSTTCSFKVTVRYIEIDAFLESVGQLTVEIPGLGLREIALRGPSTVHVQIGPAGEATDSDGNGRDDVPTEMVQLELAGSAGELGPVKVHLRDPVKYPDQRTLGRIEEITNTKPGRLDVAPFAPSGLAESFFDVFFEIEAFGKVLHNIRPKRMYSVIDHKPPGPGTTYEFPQVIELYDDRNLPTGIRLVRAGHTPNPPAPEIDYFQDSSARFTVDIPGVGQRELALSGPSTIHVWVGAAGQADDSDGNGRDDVVTQMVQLDLHGTDPDLGDIKLRLRPVTASPNKLSLGQIEETSNTQAGRLDLPPFAPAGTASSFFDVYFEVEIPRLGLLLHNAEPKRMSSTIRHKPPGPGEFYEDPQVIPLLNEQNQATGIRILKANHTPRPTEIDDFPISAAQIKLLFANGRTELLELSGPARVEVAIPPDGAASDTDADGREQVSTRMTVLDLRGPSSLGVVRLGLNADRPSIGEIEERVNATPGRLDVPPFTPTGSADSFFDVFFTVQVGGQTYFAAEPARMTSVITHKPPAPGDVYISAAKPIALLDAAGKPVGIQIVHASHVPNPPPEIDEFNFSRAQVTLRLPTGQSENVVLQGPTRVVVQIPPAGNAFDTDGDGLDQVSTEMVQLDLNGNSSMGPVHVTLNPARHSLGGIEERANNTPGRLDVPPFTPAGSATSFFDVWFQVEVGGRTLFAARPAHMESVITHKPPVDDTIYTSVADPIDLLDAAGIRTGIQLIHANHQPNPPKEIDEFYFSQAQITLLLPDGTTAKVLISGPTTVVVDIPPNGAAVDTDGDGRDQVSTEMVNLDLRGTSPLGPVHVSLNPAHRSRGEIEERANTTPGKLDLPPFTPAGSADSFFDVWFEIDVGGRQFLTARPIHMSGVITHKPPGTDTQYVSPSEPIDLLDLNGQPTGIRLVHAQHVPTRPEEIDEFVVSTAQITLEFPNPASLDIVSPSTAAISENIRLAGPAVVRVDIPPSGAATDLDGDGRDEVATRMVHLDLKGMSSLGPVRVGVRPDKATVGMIEETSNTTPGKLDLPPFTAAGTADSFFDVYFEVEVAGRTFHAAQPSRMQTVITHKPPGPLDAYVSPTQAIDLLDENGMPTGARLIHATHRPNPPRIPIFRRRPTGEIEMVIPTVRGLRYIVEVTSDLGTGPWQVLLNQPGTGGDLTITDGGAQKVRFLRFGVQK